MPVRNIPISNRSLTGRHVTGPGQRSIGFESSLERDFVSLMLFEPNAIEVEEQPIRIRYEKQEKICHYTPDFLVTFDGRPSKLVEIKYAEELRLKAEELRPKFNAAKQFAHSKTWKFEVWTENEIRIPRLENAKFLLPYLKRSDDPDYSKRIVETLFRLSDVAIAELIEECWSGDDDRAHGLSQIWRLIALRNISVDLDRELTQDANVQLNGGRENGK